MEDNPQVKDHATEFFDDAEALRFEDSIWWLAGRREILRKYCNCAAKRQRISRIADIGCGSGGHLPLLSEYGEVTGVERSEILARRARSRGIAKDIHVGDFFELDMPYEFQMTGLFDVLEHIEDDDGFLERLNIKIKPGHLLLLSVPACPFLYGPHDALLHHYRRYSKRGLETLLQRHGFTVVKGGYFLFFLFPAVMASRIKERSLSLLGRKQTAVELGVVPDWANPILRRVLKWEAAISEFIPFPIGLWLIVLAEKTGLAKCHY
jgi:SAM-dependent methyltransferase